MGNTKRPILPQSPMQVCVGPLQRDSHGAVQWPEKQWTRVGSMVARGFEGGWSGPRAVRRAPGLDEDKEYHAQQS